MPSFRLTLAYDGTDFAGSQIQPNQRTVQGELERVLGGIAANPDSGSIRGADRSWGACGRPGCGGRASSMEHDRARICDGRSTRVCRPTSARPMRPFVPSHSILGSTRHGANIATGSRPRLASPFLGRYAWTRRTDLDAEAIQAGAAAARGDARLRVIRGRRRGRSLVASERRNRGVPRGRFFAATARRSGRRFGPGSDESARVLEIRVAADGFLPHMVRNIVGALLQVGQGRRYPEWIGELLAGRDRRSRPGCGAAPWTHALASWFRWGRTRRRLNGHASGRWREGASIWNGERGRRNWLI